MTGAILRDVTIGNTRLILGNSMSILSDIGEVDHIISDPPYEQSLHDAKNGLQGRSLRSHGHDRLRTDGGVSLRGLDFAGIDEIRSEFTDMAAQVCRKWFIAFCTVEGVARWADVINPSAMKYKRACIWVKPDSTPQLNGQGPAQGAECFVTAWCGKGHAKWNSGGKRGVYTHLTNPPDRHGGHPTEKPMRLMREILLDFTDPSDVVLDPFMGSGTTLVAATLTGRPAIGIEVNPAYFEMAVHRVRKAAASVNVAGPQLRHQVQEVLL